MRRRDAREGATRRRLLFARRLGQRRAAAYSQRRPRLATAAWAWRAAIGAAGAAGLRLARRSGGRCGGYRRGSRHWIDARELALALLALRHLAPGDHSQEKYRGRQPQQTHQDNESATRSDFKTHASCSRPFEFHIVEFQIVEFSACGASACSHPIGSAHAQQAQPARNSVHQQPRQEQPRETQFPLFTYYTI